jgi:shikimate kinase
VHQAGALATLATRFVTVVLTVPWATIAERIRGDAGRPLAADAERLFAARASGYAAAGPAVDGRGAPAEVAARVLEVWRRTCAST